jgi:hypothetical protein
MAVLVPLPVTDFNDFVTPLCEDDLVETPVEEFWGLVLVFVTSPELRLLTIGFLVTLGLLTAVTVFLTRPTVEVTAGVILTESDLVTRALDDSGFVTLELAEESERVTLETEEEDGSTLLSWSLVPAGLLGSLSLYWDFGIGFRSIGGVVRTSLGRLGVLGGVFLGLELESKTLILSEMGVLPMADRRDIVWVRLRLEMISGTFPPSYRGDGAMSRVRETGPQ